MMIRKTLETYFPKPDKGNKHLCSIVVNERIAQLEKRRILINGLRISWPWAKLYITQTTETDYMEKER